MAEIPVQEAVSAVEDEISNGIKQDCPIEIPKSCGIVIFGASGDLTKRKIIPALYRLFIDKLLPAHFFVLGTARTGMSDEAFRQAMQEAVRKALAQDYKEESWLVFAQMLSYVPIDYWNVTTYQTLMSRLLVCEQKHGTNANRIFYLAIPPMVFEPVILNLGDAGLSKEEGCYSHIVIEKPLGRDLASARNLNAVLSRCFEETQIYRMDHYLAKETVQNILMFRFANAIFEPLWNRRYIDHVQITVSETIGIENRAGYYETSGIIRDMFQNHIFQLLALIAMEPPALFESGLVHDEKAKVLRSVQPFNLGKVEETIVLGQYGRGIIGGQEVIAYREETGIPKDSLCPTYGAMQVLIDNWRWNGVPFYLRSGKRLSVRNAEVSIHFRSVPHSLFSPATIENIEANTLVLRLQPNEGISLSVQAKKPGSSICLDTVLMDFSYQNVFMLEAYERVLLNCMQGDQMLFARADGIEVTWELLTPLIEKIERESDKAGSPNTYAAGTAGPVQADELLKKDGRLWRPL